MRCNSEKKEELQSLIINNESQRSLPKKWLNCRLTPNLRQHCGHYERLTRGNEIDQNYVYVLKLIKKNH